MNLNDFVDAYAPAQKRIIIYTELLNITLLNGQDGK
jgi:hypothetical protein